ncbi:MAG: hypothetical protein ACXVQY_08675 [Actinomycetota bacterium]
MEKTTRALRATGRIALGLVVLLTAATVSYRVFDRAWADGWGATRAEATGALPGDTLVGHPVSQTTRAVTIAAPVADVWPWLVQFGAGRGGLYSYDLAERLTGANIHNVERIVPSLQHVGVGDTIWVTPEGHPAKLVFKVAEVTPERALVLAHTKEPHAAGVPADTGWTWSFSLQPLDATHTRLVLRAREASLGNAVTDAIQSGLVGPIGFAMERKTLLGIKSRAEELVTGERASTAGESVMFELLVLGAAAAVAIASTKRRPWWLRLGIGALATGVLTQALIRGFPSLWYALLCDIAIGAAVFFTYRARAPRVEPTLILRVERPSRAA